MSDALTLVLPLIAKAGVPVEDFYGYWLNQYEDAVMMLFIKDASHDKIYHP